MYLDGQYQPPAGQHTAKTLQLIYMANRIKVQAPATLSNLNCGFDVLGVAIDTVCDEIIGRTTAKPGLNLLLRGNYARQTPADPTKNTAGVAVLRYLQYIGATKTAGLELEMHKYVRPGSGLGTSAASASAAVFMANELMGRPLERKALLPFALLGEHAADQSFHADNVAPCVLGGLILVRDFRTLDMQKLAHPRGLMFALVYPEIRVLTSESRAGLVPQVPLRQFVQQTANIAGFVQAMLMSDFDLIARTMVDAVIEPQRAGAIPCFEQMKDAALAAGALSFGISGSGPTVFALCPNRHIAETCTQAMQKTLHDSNVGSESYVAGINERGVELC